LARALLLLRRMRHLARLAVILIALSASTRALAQTPALDYQRAVEGARNQRHAGIVLTFVGVGFSAVGTALLLAGALTAGEADGPWVGLFLSGTIFTPFGATLDATGIPLWATARVKF
jgi:hypothetical protein